ncbi:MAG: sulfatase [Candidatus Omnitrophota bacterium]
MLYFNRTKVTSVIIVLLLLAAISVFLISFRYNQNKPNVILITIDALRADHLSCHGYKRQTSTNIDALAIEGTAFTNCYSVSTATAASTPSLMTGRYLGINDIHAFFNSVLDKRFTTLAEYLKNAGYYTTAFFNNGNYRWGTGFEQGFDYYKDYAKIHGDAEAITNDISDFLNKRSGHKPFFIWAHYINVHAPYNAPEKYVNAFEGDELWVKNGKKLNVNPKPEAEPDDSWGFIPKVVFREDKYYCNYYIARYDAAIRYTDSHIKKLFRKIPENTLVVLTADHGEFLGEHNSYFCHGGNIYDAVLHIPLIIKDDKYFKKGGKISMPVSSVDIVPTILSRINPIWYFFNKSKFDGIDLKRNLEGSNIRRKYIYSYAEGSMGIRDVNKNVKYILNGGGEEELYFLPDEDNNLIENDSKAVISIKKELVDNLKIWLKDYPVSCDINPAEASLNEETEENLRSLGYLH